MQKRNALVAACAGTAIAAATAAPPASAKGDYCDPNASPKVCLVVDSVGGSGMDISSFRVTVAASSAGGYVRIFPKFQRTDFPSIRTFPYRNIPISTSGSFAQFCPLGHISKDMWDGGLTMPCGNAGHAAWMWVGIARYNGSGNRVAEWPGSNSNSVAIK